MKKITIKFLLILTSLLWREGGEASAQTNNIGIGTLTPAPSALLDIDASPGNNKGVLVPRMTAAQRLAIVLPANSLLVFDTDSACFFYYKTITASWKSLCSGGVGAVGATGATGITGATGVTGSTGFLSPGTAPGNTTYWDGTQWVLNSNNIYNAGTTVGIGAGATPAASAKLDVSSTTQGALIPRMTTTQRNAIVSPATSLLIYNITTDCLEMYSASGVWISLGCGSGGCVTPPTTANAGTDITLACGINIATLAGNTPSTGTGAWSVVFGTATITNPGSPTSGVTGLANAGTTTLRWTISNSPCPPSTDDIVITTSSCFTCGTPLTDARDGKTYNTVLIGTQCWMAANLDYSTSGTFTPGVTPQSNNATIEKYCYADNAANCAIYGGLYQWAETVQYTNGASNTTSWSPVPSGNVQGVCPTGWHIPTDAEWCTMENTVEPGTDVGCNTLFWRGVNTGGKLKEVGTSHWTSGNTGATNTSGFTALPGGYSSAGGLFADAVFACNWWSASESTNTTAWYRYLYFSDTRVDRYDGSKGNSYSVRCLKD